MSTFSGFVAEFPDIRIDRFLQIPGKPPPLAGFLSHVHSDHLIGLESLKAPFIYCSAATKELILRLEKFPYRMNFSNGILERRRQTYKHLQKLLKSLPLNTAVNIELSAGNNIQVTLLDANHCLGSVMFLIEGKGKAILYTGDVRAESWWVNSLLRNPCMVQYTTVSRLDNIYLDTTFATKGDPYRIFPSKAEGVRELLGKVSRYPEDTIFYFNSWTFGYEEVWIALSKVLETDIHLDPYRHALYTSICDDRGTSVSTPEAPILCGFAYGNRHQPGILTTSIDGVRLHSCEKGTGCPIIGDRWSKVVEINPIISRHNNAEVLELGAGGGHGDLDQAHDLDLSDVNNVDSLLSLCSSQIEDAELLQKVAILLKSIMQSDDKRLHLEHLQDAKFRTDCGGIVLDRLPEILTHLARSRGQHVNDHPVGMASNSCHRGFEPNPLHTSVTFSYSRHSSYSELRNLIAALQPREIHPNTAPPPREWSEDSSMSTLFGDIYENREVGFAFDNAMRKLVVDSRLRTRTRTRCWDGAYNEKHLVVGHTTLEEDCLPATQQATQQDTQCEVMNGFHDAVDIVDARIAPGCKAARSCVILGSERATRCETTVLQADGADGNHPAKACASAPRIHTELSAGFKRPSPTPRLSKVSTYPFGSKTRKLRRDAFKAALKGNWHDIQLATTTEVEREI